MLLRDALHQDPLRVATPDVVHGAGAEVRADEDDPLVGFDELGDRGQGSLTHCRPPDEDESLHLR